VDIALAKIANNISCNIGRILNESTNWETRDIFQAGSLAKLHARKIKSREIRGAEESDFAG